MTPRTALLDEIDAAFANSHCVALLGPRQCGKTTLARAYAARDRNVRVFDLEDPLDVAELANPRLVLGALQGVVVIDEIQRQPSLLPLLRVLLDRELQPARFLILGSASPSLLRGAAESLAGRVAFIEIGGFVLTEVDGPQQQELWWRGGFPRSLLARTDAASYRWRLDYLRTFYEVDLRQLGINIAPAAISRALAMLAHHHGQLFNGSELARSLGVAQTTARHYLDVLTAALITRQLQPWHANLAKRQVKSPKFYVRDSGLLHALLQVESAAALARHPSIGASFEGYVVEQILRTAPGAAYFWRTQAGAELDLLLVHKDRRIGIEVKHNEAPSTTKSMHIAIQDLALDELWVVYRGEREFALHERIRAMGVQRACEILLS